LDVAQTAAREIQGTVQRAVAVESLGSNATRYMSGATVTGNAFVWLVEVAGHFQCTDCSGLSGALAGTVLALYIDAKTLQEIGFGLSNKWVDLSHLGPVIVLRS
jgi:hypothetical protein